jgi:hypothetical protein
MPNKKTIIKQLNLSQEDFAKSQIDMKFVKEVIDLSSPLPLYSHTLSKHQQSNLILLV